MYHSPLNNKSKKKAITPNSNEPSAIEILRTKLTEDGMNFTQHGNNTPSAIDSPVEPRTDDSVNPYSFSRLNHELINSPTPVYAPPGYNYFPLSSNPMFQVPNPNGYSYMLSQGTCETATINGDSSGSPMTMSLSPSVPTYATFSPSANKTNVSFIRSPNISQGSPTRNIQPPSNGVATNASSASTHTTGNDDPSTEEDVVVVGTSLPSTGLEDVVVVGTSLPSIPTFRTLEENRTILPACEWNYIIQEEVASDVLLAQSKRVKYPRMWKMAGLYAESWRNHGWFSPNKRDVSGRKNISIFKNRLLNRILLTRGIPQHVESNKVLVDSIVEGTKAVSADEARKTILENGVVYVYPQDLFLDFAIRNWSLDVISTDKHRDLHTVNDILRLFSVMGMNDHRSDVLSLSRHKVASRNEMDQAMNREDMIFLRISKNFNNNLVKVNVPTEFDTLSEKNRMNPNEISRTTMNRSPKWLKQLYKDTMKEYKIAMHKWTKGTRGGLVQQKIMQIGVSVIQRSLHTMVEN